MKTKQKISIRSLAKTTGADRASVARWTVGITDEKEALACIREHQQAGKAKSALDPETGLTWFQARMRESTLRERRENEQAAGVQSKEWMSTPDHHRILRALVDRIDQLPGKLRSELGLSDVQTTGLQRALDDARTNAANAVEVMEGKA